MNNELEELAEIRAQWVDPVPGIRAIYLFGSRARGDHKPDSDVDVRVYPEESDYDQGQETVKWWEQQEDTKFADLQQRLPGRLHLGRDKLDWGNIVDQKIMEARQAGRIVLTSRKVICLRTPPKASPFASNDKA
jgi:predicted nucleotidyltransferase